jgi:hypothetical protein
LNADAPRLIIASALIVVLVLGGCAADRSGRAGPFGPQPQSRLDKWPYTEVWKSPYPTPFGTVGLRGIPPRPTHAPAYRRADRSPVPTVAPAGGPLWTTAAEAYAALGYQPALPEGAVVFEPPFFWDGRSAQRCPVVDHAVAVRDVEAYYAEVRHALLRAGFLIDHMEAGLPLGRFTEGLLRATSAAANAEVSGGEYDPRVWPRGRALGVTQPWLVRVMFTQRCIP